MVPLRPQASPDLATLTRIKVVTQRGLNVFVDENGNLSSTKWPSPPTPIQPAALFAYSRKIQDLSRRSVFTLELPPSGPGVLTHLGRFVLRAFNGMYVCAENGGGGVLVANRQAAAEWETFLADSHPEPPEYCRTVYLRCADGRRWLSAFGGGGEGLSSTATRAGGSEKFELIAADPGSGGFPANAQVHLRTSSRHYLQAANGGGGEVSARGPWPREWETFTLTLPEGAAQLDDGQPFGLMTATRRFVSAEPGAAVVQATATRRGDNETFVNSAAPVPGTVISGSQGGVETSVTAVPGQSSVQEGAATEQRVGDYVCSVTPVTISQSFSEALLLDPLSDAVWPGSIVDGLRWANGEYRVIPEPRAPLVVSLSVESLHGAPVSATVANPKLDTVRESLNALRAGLVGETLPAQIQASVEEVHSTDQLQVALQAGYSGLLGKLKAKFDYSSTTTTNKYVWRYQQVYYTADVTPPSQPSGWFQSGRTPLRGEMYVASVSYGRMLLFTLESSEDKSTIEGALDFAMGKSVSASLKVKYEAALSKSTINVFILGGPTGLAEQVVTGGVEAIRPYIQSGGTFGTNTSAVPLSYRLRFLTDNALGYIGLTTSFTRRHCMRATGRFQVEGMYLKVGTVSDDSPDLELFGTVWVSGGIEGVAGDVPISPTGEVWKRDKKHWVTLRRDQTTPATISPVLTYPDIYRQFDKCFIKVVASLYDYDAMSANDHITAGPMMVWLRDLTPGQEYGFPCEGDGNRVYVHFKIRPIE